jgi:predicted nucleic acid-binding protein
MPDKVVDASVIAALAFLESRAEEARDLLRNATLFAPEILPYELASVALKKARALPSRRFDIVSGLRDALALGVRLIPMAPLELLELSLETNLSVYDAAYLQIARQLGCTLVTFDAKLERQARRITRV